MYQGRGNLPPIELRSGSPIWTNLFTFNGANIMGERKVKVLSLEEGGYSVLLLVAAIFCLIIAGKTWDQVLAFHTSLIAIASLAGIFFIFAGISTETTVRLREKSTVSRTTIWAP